VTRGSFNGVSNDDGDGRWIDDSALHSEQPHLEEIRYLHFSGMAFALDDVGFTGAKRKLFAPAEYFGF
jgi:hypothetical protein